MKIEFAQAIKNISQKDKNLLFLTGDLGFNAFEDLIATMGKRFINAGVAEQNMVSLAAGLTKTGFKPWVYSIAPFLILKAYEQIRNDICHLQLPVKLVGNGGGYGYGIMGESHHMLEDIAVLAVLPGMKIYAPAFSEDVETIVKKMHAEASPAYIRMNLVPKTLIHLPKYTAIRRIAKGNKLTIIAFGPLVHNVLAALHNDSTGGKIDLWCITELPVDLPKELLLSLRKTKKLILIEEHRKPGGMGEKILSSVVTLKISLEKIIHAYAVGYPSTLYGSREFHMLESGLDANAIASYISKLL